MFSILRGNIIQEVRKMSKKKQKKNEKARRLAENWQMHEGNSDVLGSWTGTPEDDDDRPVQDADDL